MRIGRKRLGDALVELGAITTDQLLETLKAQESGDGRKRRLGLLVLDAGYASEDDVARALAHQCGFEFIDLDKNPPQRHAADAIPQQLAQRHLVVGVEWREDRIVLAMADPNDVVALDDIRVAIGNARIEIVVATKSSILRATRKIYAMDMSALQLLEEEPPSLHPVGPEEDLSVATLQKTAQSAPIVRMVNSILLDAARQRATDVHVEPQRENLRIRYRIDGILREVLTLPKHSQSLVVSRLKILGGMDIAERRRPQDGRISLTVDGFPLDARTSSFPTYSGEKIVIRLLPVNPTTGAIDALGFDELQVAQLTEHLHKPQGLLVFTGPTGAGKTSTMYAALTHLKNNERNIVTLEDPIEYQISGINQGQMDEKAGITFASGLRSILRQDPDIILVGEIRDAETARTVIQASLSGHLVLSSLHTNDAAAAMTRLIDLGVEPYLIASGLSLVVAQRLVRLICPECKIERAPAPEMIASVGLNDDDLVGATFVDAPGCPACGHSGFSGRTGVFEVLPMTTRLRDNLAIDQLETAIRSSARSAGVLSLRQCGLRLALDGRTTLAEVIRVTPTDQIQQTTRPCGGCAAPLDPEWSSCPYCGLGSPHTENVLT